MTPVHLDPDQAAPDHVLPAQRRPAQSLPDHTVLAHTECGHDTTAVLTCSHCGDELHRSTVRVLPGPGPGAAALFPVPSHARAGS